MFNEHMLYNECSHSYPHCGGKHGKVVMYIGIYFIYLSSKIIVEFYSYYGLHGKEEHMTERTLNTVGQNGPLVIAYTVKS